MKYDPIMCMNVPDSVKTKDANKYVEKAVQLIKEGKGPIAILSTLKGMGLTPVDANSYYAEAKSLTGYRSYDEKTIDKAIRNCDRDPYEYETIKNDIDIAARGKASYITKSSLQSRITRGSQTNRLTKEQKEELWRLAESVKQ